jgi:serine/threonine protein phosphatase 1
MRWVIGDVHGMRQALEGLLAGIQRADPDAKLYFVGDYVNRGPESSGVIDLVLTLKNARFIRGNHDDIFDQVLTGHCYAPNASKGDRAVAFKWFTEHGLIETFQSYGIANAQIAKVYQRPQFIHDIVAAIPPPHIDFIHNLPAVIDEDEFFLVHGKWDTNEFSESPSIAEQVMTDPARRHQLLWGRFSQNELAAPKAWQRVGYFGHTPVDNYPALLGNRDPVPLRGTKIVLLDTAAALLPNGRLTAFCHEQQMCLQADRQGKLVPG